MHHNRTQKQLQHFSLNITNFLFWVLSLAPSIKNDNTNLQKLWCLSACKKWTASLNFLRNCKDIANLLIWVLWERLIKPINNASIALKENLMPKVLKSAGKKFDVYLHAKNQRHLELYFSDIVKTLQKYDFRIFGKAWPFPSKMIASI